jgi:nucleoside triphosphate pyrophosphatase
MIVLASQSPRRKELFELFGWDFTILPTEVDETPHPDELPAAYVLRLAETKARALSVGLPAGSIVIGADTAVVDGDEILGKPSDPDAAIRMLRQLRGRVHEVYTALAVLESESGRLVNDLCVTRVPMRRYTDGEIRDYVDSGDPMDKAGAYAIQHAGFNPVDNLSGCYASVMGLPLCHLTRTLRKLGIFTQVEIPPRCQEELNYDCRVFDEILSSEGVYEIQVLD